MGRESTAPVTITDATGRTLESADDVHVLLESTELILRGPLRRRYALSELQEVSATADLLRARAGGERIEIELPPAVARRWADKILTPPPTLAEKLGLIGAPLVVIGRLTDPVLLQVVTDIAATTSTGIPVALAEIDGASDLDAALDELPPDAAIWLAHRKGRGDWVGDAAIRETMRSRGFIDTKVAAVSPERTATRYIERRSPLVYTPQGERAGGR